MKPSTKIERLRHYTSLPYLLNVLESQSLWLADPAKWEDKNDRELIEQYRQAMKLKKVFAICLAECGETYHHWKIYAGNPAGMCIQFNAPKLIASIKRVPGLRMKTLTYVRVDRLHLYKNRPKIWPFLKRLPFEGEREFRLILDYKKDDNVGGVPLKFDIKAIECIYINPWLGPAAKGPITRIIRQMPGCAKVRLTQTTLIDNHRWASTFSATKSSCS
jgi:hypothetical protein